MRDCIGQPDLIGALTEAWSEVLISTDFEGGCPIVAAAFSRAEAPEAANAAADVFAEWSQLLADRLEADGIKPGEARSLSAMIVAALEGAVMLSRASRSIEPLEDVSHHLSELIAQHRSKRREQTRTARR